MIFRPSIPSHPFHPIRKHAPGGAFRKCHRRTRRELKGLEERFQHTTVLKISFQFDTKLFQLFCQHEANLDFMIEIIFKIIKLKKIR